jgi:SAM-dependent methyltransferase
MLDGLRKRLGPRTRHPAPTVAGPAEARRLKQDLEAFYTRAEPRFRRLFLHGKPLPPEIHEKGAIALYERAGLVRQGPAGICVPCVRVFPLYGAMIATDLLTHEDEDQVFSLMLEQIYVVRNLGVRPGDHVLELCVGSGVNSLFASDHAGSVTGVDVSPRALEFARFNVALNPGGVGVDLRQGSLYEPLGADERFDVVLVNPPFELVPPGTRHFLHSHGGEDGLDVVRACLAGAEERLRPGGRFEMFTWSPGRDDGAVVPELMQAAFPGRRIEVHIVDGRPLEDRIAAFASAPGFADWRRRLKGAGITRVWGVFVRATPDGAPGIEVLDRRREVAECSVIVGEWA